MGQEDKIDQMNGLLHEMKPMLESVVDGQKTMDARMRSIEVRAEQHHVKIGRLQSDMDGMGQLVRRYSEVKVTSGINGINDLEELRGTPRGGKWLAILEFLAVAPQYWHIIISIFMTAITVCTLVLRHYRI